MKFQCSVAIDGHTARAYGRQLGTFLRKRREELGLSQEDVALRADMDRRHYQELEYGFSNSRTRTPANPRLLTLINLAVALEMDIDDFLSGLGRAFSPMS